MIVAIISLLKCDLVIVKSTLLGAILLWVTYSLLTYFLNTYFLAENSSLISINTIYPT
jgi:hypothetical protein